jgi:hypothetical protein
MKKIFDYIGASFDNSKEGASARKLTAFALMICVAYLHYKFVDITTSVSFLIVDLCGVFMLLGIITAEQVIKLKNGTNNNEK